MWKREKARHAGLFEWQRMGLDGLNGLDGCASLGLGWMAMRRLDGW